ncbi:MAG TPA: hypothetical protein VIK28_07310 [Sedimentisphaerales bacterium]
MFGIILAVGNLSSLSAIAENVASARRVFDFQKDGVKFQIKASIKADTASPYSKHDDDQNTASLAVKIRISAHATESQYFGEVSKSFPNFKPDEGSDEKLFWQDDTCHQRRGLPKTTVTTIDGTIAGEKGKVSINALPRHLGMLLPSDEISAGKRLPDGADKNGNFIAYRSQTKLSRLFVDVKVYVIDCDLTAGAPPMIPANRQPR